MRKYFSLLILLLSASSFASEPIKIGVISDVHFLSQKLVNDGAAYKNFQNATGRNLNDLHAVLDVVLHDFEIEKIDILLVSGDITNHGERQSHIDFIAKLEPLQQTGTRIFVIPGNHDIEIPDSKAYLNNQSTPTPNISAQDFTELFKPFGYGDALRRDTASLSYLSEINDNTWLLCFDTNRYAENKTTSVSGGRILPQTMRWALQILSEAKEKNITVLGMMHHGLVEHFPYQSTLFANYLVDEWQKNAQKLADAGLKVVFTGHFHANDITLFTSPSGNTIYDVETASLAQYPFAYRVMQICDGKLAIDTRFVTSVPGNPKLEEQSRNRLEIITRRVSKSKLSGMGIPFPTETIDALTEIILNINMLHVRGDETPDEEMKAAIKNLAQLMGSEESDSDFQLDFPPADNRLVIDLRSGSWSLD